MLAVGVTVVVAVPAAVVCEAVHAQLVNVYPDEAVATRSHVPSRSPSVAVALPPVPAAAVTV